METKTKTSHKLKYIVISVALILVIGISAILLVLHNTKISYYIEAEKPYAIVLYNNSENKNIYYEQDTTEFNEIYLSILNGFKQDKLSSLLSNKLFYKPSIANCDNTKLAFEGIKVKFVYSSAQPVKLNNSSYELNNQVYWYNSLIFNITSNDEYSYTNIVILPSENDSNFTSRNTYNVYYTSYANFASSYNVINSHFS